MVVFGLAAIFYYWKNQDKPEEIKTVEVEESITATDADPTDTENGPREYISEYFKEKDGFNAIGVSWEEVNTDPKDITFFIRTKDGDEESQWFEVYGDLVKTEGERSFYAAETPILVRGNEYQYKVVLQKPENQVENIKFDIINTMGTSYSRLFDGIESFFSNKASAGSWNPANIISRNTWGGTAVDVSATLWPPQFASSTKKFMVHHTVSLNYGCANYSQEKGEADVRAIWSYHTYTRDWGDIGYNYLVDPCGRVYEGRYSKDISGVYRENVIAGHAAPYNYDESNDSASIGISVIGNFDDTSDSFVPTSDITDGLGKIIGYKSYVHSIDTLGYGSFGGRSTSLYTGGVLYNVAGHKDYTATACPGKELYPLLPTIRSKSEIQKEAYIFEYGDHEQIANNITLYRARFTIDNIVTSDPTDQVSVTTENPALGEQVNTDIALRNENSSEVTLKDIKISGVLDSGSEFVIGEISELGIASGEVVTFPQISYNINLALYQSYRITYNLALVGPDGSTLYFRKTPTIVNQYFSYPRIIPHYPVIKATSLPVTSDPTPRPGVATSINYTLKNLDPRPAYLRNVYTKIVFGESVYYTTVSKPEPLYTNETFDYTATFTFSSTGTYNLMPYVSFVNKASIQLENTNNTLVTSSVLVATDTPTVIDYSKISLNTFRVSMEDATTPDNETDYLLADFPAIGEPVTIRSTLKNSNNYPVTLYNIRVIGQLDTGTLFVVGTIPVATISATSTLYLTPQTFNITSFSTHSFYIEFKVGTRYLRPYVKPTYSYQQIKAHYPNVWLVRTPVISPATPLVKSPVTVTYSLKNYDARPAYLREVNFAAVSGTTRLYFGSTSPKIAPQDMYQYSKTITPVVGGTFWGTGRIIYGNGYVSYPRAAVGCKTSIYFTIHTETATLEGYAIPTTYGKVGREQHLYLNKAEYDLGRTVASALLHYQNSSTPSYAQNGMAGGSGAFGAYFGCSPMSTSCSMPIADERYYITMRWSYVTWYEAPDGTCTSLLDGHLDTCKKDYSSLRQSWHKQKRVIVTNPANGKKVVASVLEAGPSIWTGRVAGVSPEAMYALGASTNDNLKYYWAVDQSIPLGLIN